MPLPTTVMRNGSVPWSTRTAILRERWAVMDRARLVDCRAPVIGCHTRVGPALCLASQVTPPQSVPGIVPGLPTATRELKPVTALDAFWRGFLHVAHRARFALQCRGRFAVDGFKHKRGGGQFFDGLGVIARHPPRLSLLLEGPRPGANDVMHDEVCGVCGRLIDDRLRDMLLIG